MSTQKDVVAYPVGANPPTSPGGSNPYSGNYSYQPQATAGTYAAPPAPAYPSVVVAGNPTGDHYSTQQQPPSHVDAGPPTGRWRDGLFDCFANIWPSCGCNFIFHGSWLVSQIAEKTGCTSFNSIMIPFSIAYVICTIISLFAGFQGVYYIPIIPMWIVCIFLRFHLIRRYNIEHYGVCLEGMIACFCCSCSLCQMARHVYGYRKAFDGDSDPQVKDYYTV